MTTIKKGLILKGQGRRRFTPLPTVAEGSDFEVYEATDGYLNICARIVETISQELERGNSLVSVGLIDGEDFLSDKPTLKARLVFDDGIRHTA